MNVLTNYVRTVDSAPVGGVLTPCCKWTFSIVPAVLVRLASVHLGTQTSSHTAMLHGTELCTFPLVYSDTGSEACSFALHIIISLRYVFSFQTREHMICYAHTII